MNIALFYHSLISDWNHGNAHFLRGVASELKDRGHVVNIYEPESAWSVTNLIGEYGDAPLHDFETAYPDLTSTRYDLLNLELERILDDCDLVIVHEWSDYDLVRRIGEHRRSGGDYLLLFHDTHHRAASAPEQMAAYDLSGFDGVLAFGEAIRQIYLQNGWTPRAWTWHEAADTRLFKPIPDLNREGDLVWIGNWGDEERTAELHEFLLEPVKALGLTARVHGVRYPPHALEALRNAGIEYGGWLPNFRVPEVFARFRVTAHVPRRPYVQALPGIPTIRPFEAMACGIPLVSAPWDDVEHLFTPGEDYLVARNGEEMRRHLYTILNDAAYARALAEHGYRTIHARHTCAHRVEELMAICEEMGVTSEDRERGRAGEGRRMVDRPLAHSPAPPLS